MTRLYNTTLYIDSVKAYMVLHIAYISDYMLITHVINM